MIQNNVIGLPIQNRQAIAGIPQLSQTAAGNSQGTAVALLSDFNVFTTVAASTGCILPIGADQTIGNVVGNVQPPDMITVVNYGANALSVYPQTGGKLGNGSANAAQSIAAGKLGSFYYVGSGNWALDISA